MQLHTETSCVFVGGAIFFGAWALVMIAIGGATGWIAGGMLMLLPIALIVMSRRGVTIYPSERVIVHHNGIGRFKLRERRFEVDASCELVLVDWESDLAPGGYVVRVRDGERALNLLLTSDGPDADELVTALADELRLPIIDRYEKRGRRMVLEHHEQRRLDAP